MKLRFFTAFLMLTASFYSLAQSDDELRANAEKRATAGILEAVHSQIPSLGMNVVGIEGDYHVLASKNARFVIKGTLTDFWDGVLTPKAMELAYPQLPDTFPESSFFVRLGTVGQPQIRVYVTPSCTSCDLVFEQLSDPDVLSRFDIHVALLNNNEQDALLANKVYCAKDEEKAMIFNRLIIEGDLDFYSTLSSCKTMIPEQINRIALEQRVSMLPMTFFVDSGKAVIGDPDAFMH